VDFLARVRRFVLAVLILLGVRAAPLAAHSYERLKLVDVAVLSEVIVAGTITSVEDKHIELAVEDVLVGDPGLRSLRVRRFESWALAERWTPYAVGQRLVLCAWEFRESDGSPRELWIVGGGDEGEMPFAGEHVVIQNSFGYRVRGLEPRTLSAAGAPITGTDLSYAELATAIRGLRAACEWNTKSGGLRLAEIAPRAEFDSFETLARSSKLARHLLDELRSADAWTAEQVPPPTAIERARVSAIAALEHGFAGRARLAPGSEPGEFDRKVDTGFGSSSAWLGDLDADGPRDIAVGAPSDRLHAPGHGVVWLLRLDEHGQPRARSELAPPAIETSKEDPRPARFGEALATLGDLDGDGAPELAIGAPGAEFPRQLGAVFVTFLTRDGKVARSVELGAQAPLRAAGVGPYSGIGCALAHLGDLDGDGATELAVGQSPNWFLASKLDPSRSFEFDRSVLLASIERHGSVRRVRKIGGAELGLELDHGFLGGSLAAIGDVDGNGVADLAIGDSIDDEGGRSRGAVWIALLNADGSVRGKQKIGDWSGNFTGLLRDEDHFGGALAGPGDVDGDTVPDLLVASDRSIWTLLLRPDGTVRAHEQIQVPDTEALLDLSSSISCAPRTSASERPRIAVGAHRVLDSGWESTLLWLSAKADGTLAAW